MTMITHKSCMAVAMIVSTFCSVAWAAQSSDECHAPRYTIASRRMAGKRSREVNLAISIDPENISWRNLLAVACRLREDFRSSGLIRVDIFNNYAAARRDDVIGGGDPGPQTKDPKNYIAAYFFDRAKHEEHLVLWGDVRNCANNIIIDLPSKRPRSACDY